MASTHMINDMYFMCEQKKRRSNNNIYRVLVDGTTIKIKSPRIHIPFGGEMYNKKMVLNLEVDPEINNEYHNFHAKLNQIDIAFRDMISNIKNDDNNVDEQFQIKNIPVDMLNDVENKEFTSCIRNGKKGYIIRTHVKNGVTPHSYDNKEFYTFSQIKNTFAYIELELYGVWTTSTSYGYILNVCDVSIS